MGITQINKEILNFVFGVFSGFLTSIPDFWAGGVWWLFI
jgi:hypothetical protein